MLTHLKSNALQQQQQAASFGISQTRVSRLAAVLLGVLNQVLARRGLLPARDGAELARRLVHHPDPVFAYDGVERNADRATPTATGKPKSTALKKPTA